LRPTGSLYLHCDYHASHYLKIMMDDLFDPGNFRNEIVWKRTSARSNSHKWNHIHDTILFYTKSDRYTWNPQYTAYDPSYIEKFYRHVEPGTGRRYASDNLTAAGTREGSSGEPWRGIDVRAKGIHWKYTIERLEELDREGRIIWPKKEGVCLATNGTSTRCPASPFSQSLPIFRPYQLKRQRSTAIPHKSP
jgi:adenine specific DNA methylase Mod